MICLKCGINQISIVHLFYGFLPHKVSVRFLLSVSIFSVYFQIKKDTVLVMLKKKAPMMTWICVSRADKKPMDDKKKK